MHYSTHNRKKTGADAPVKSFIPLLSPSPTLRVTSSPAQEPGCARLASETRLRAQSQQERQGLAPPVGGRCRAATEGGGTLSAKLTERVFPRRAPQRPPCVKGAVSEADWGIDNPSVCPPGRHLPLHKGGFHWPRAACFPSKSRSSGGIIPRPPIAAAVRAAIRLRRSTEAWQ